MDSNGSQDSDYESITKSQSASQPQSVSKQSITSSSIVDLAKSHLLSYQDVIQSQFQLLPISIAQPIIHISQYSSYMNSCATQMPIGANYQAVIPNIMPYSRYKKRREQQLVRLKSRKIHDPYIDGEFYKKNRFLVQSIFGVERTYEDINKMRNAYVNSNMGCSFEEYLKEDQILEYWQNHFHMQEKYQVKQKRKKRRVK